MKGNVLKELVLGDLEGEGVSERCDAEGRYGNSGRVGVNRDTGGNG